MSWWSSILSWFGRGSLAAWDESGHVSSHAGARITAENALSVSAVFCCVRAIAEDCAKLPLEVYRREGDGKSKATDHPLYRTFKREANEDSTSYDARFALHFQSLLFGNAYAEWVRDGGRVRYYPLWTPMVEVRRDDNRALYYRHATEQGTPVDLPQARVLHIKGVTPDGVLGIATTHAGREAIGLALAAHQFTSSYFANGASTGEAIIAPGAMKREDFEAWVNTMRSQYEGAGKQHRTRYFDQDVKVVSGGGVDPEKSQLIETLRFSAIDVARYFRCPPHKIYEAVQGSSMTYQNVEQVDIEYRGDTLLPRLVQVEQELSRKLLRPEEEDRYAIEHNMSAHARADLKSRMEAQKLAIEARTLSPNEARAMENRNPYPGGDAFEQGS